jgi:nicotinic acid mononucleotide adenylyltransferase
MGHMKKYSQFLKELPNKTVVFAFGRFNPPTTGHELLIKAVKKLAATHKADHAIYASKTQDSKKNPLTVDKKVHYLNLMFPGTHFVAANEQERTFIEAVKNLNKKYKSLIMVAGSDRVPEYEKILTKYNGKEFHYDTVQVISAGERDPDADDATGMSASKMRAAASKGDYNHFKQGLPSTMRDIDGRRLMNDVRMGMGLESIKEQINLVKNDLREQYFRGEIFNIGDIVEANGNLCEIVKRGSNHLLLKEESGKLVSKWLQDVSIAEELHLEESMLPEELTDKTLKPTDKIKVARIIATMLGTDNAEASANPEVLVNTALRKIRSKALNPEALKILDKMLALATEVGIQYDATLKPSKLKEGVIQPNGTDEIPVTTDSPVVNKNSKFNIAKDRLRYSDFVKLKKMNTPEIAEDTLDEISQKLAGDYYGAATKKHLAKVGMKPNMYDRIEKDMGKQRKAGIDRALNRLTKESTDEEDADSMMPACPICNCTDCKEATHGYSKAMEPTFDPFFKEESEAEPVKSPVVDLSAYEGDYDHNMEGEEISDEDLDKMAEEIDDIDDVIDMYDEDELAIVDDETGEEIPDTEEEKQFSEQAIMEVLSRIERMRAKMRIKRSSAKRERATKIALRTYSGSEKINKRARRLAIKLMKTRLLRGRDPTKVSVGEKERIERTIEKRKVVIGRLAMRLAPRVRKIEKARMTHTKFTQGSTPNVSI